MKGLLFTFALSYGGAATALFKPFYGLLAYVCFAIIRPEALWHYSVPAGGNYSRIVAIGLIVGWVISGFGNWSFGRAKPIVMALLGYLGWSVVSALAAPNQTVAWIQVEATAKIVLPFIIGITTIHTTKQLTALAWVIIASEGWVAFELNQNFRAGIYNFFRELTFADLDNNGVAITMVCAAGLAFFFGMRETGWRRWAAFAACGLMGHVVMFSQSRGGMLALIITGVVSFLFVRKTAKHYALFFLALAVALRLAGPMVWERFETIFVEAENRDSSAESRLQLSKTCLEMMSDNPVTGVGPAHFKLNSHLYGWTAGKDGHTTWLQTGAELGVPGLAFLSGFYLLTMKQCWSLTRMKAPEMAELSDAGRMVIASLVGFMVSAQFVTVYSVELPYYVALLGACAVKIADLYPPEPEQESIDDWHAAAHA